MAKGIDFTVYRGSENGSIHKDTTHRDGLQGDEVHLRITHSGVCGTDEHYQHTGQVLGHEGVGVVEDLGPGCSLLKKGDKVGFGYLHTSCGHCEQCLKGQETYCATSQARWYGTGDFDLGSFASHTVWREAFLFKIPDGIDPAHAAPLMCGGATVFTPLHEYGIRPSDRVGVMGVGGLGHLAIQFFSKAGCEVVVFSGTDSKKEEALSLGAKEFYATKGAKEIQVSKPVNVLLITTSAQPDWNLFLPVLAPQATVFPLSIDPTGELKLPYLPLVLGGHRIQGSVVANRATHNTMLNFAAAHGIKPIIQEYPLNEEGIEKAFGDLSAGKVRYRGVLVAEK